jgi:hypothetical protein
MLDGAFCAQCGQKAAPLNPSLGEFLHELFHELAHVDGKIFQIEGHQRWSQNL